VSPILVLAGGLSHERDVSLRSGRRVAEALRGVGLEVLERDVDAHLLTTLRTDRPACVVPMLHGATGEDGAIREVLELLDVPYVGAPPAACRVAFDKPVAKAVAARAGILTPDSFCLPHETFRELGAAAVMAALVDRLGLPLMVKPAKSGSALGCSVVHSAEELPSAMVSAFAYGDVALLERFVEGLEVAVPVFDDGSGPRALPAVAIEPDGGV
jgi:D-alanine-D-alanine ligase